MGGNSIQVETAPLCGVLTPKNRFCGSVSGCGVLGDLRLEILTAPPPGSLRIARIPAPPLLLRYSNNLLLTDSRRPSSTSPLLPCYSLANWVGCVPDTPPLSSSFGQAPPPRGGQPETPPELAPLRHYSTPPEVGCILSYQLTSRPGTIATDREGGGSPGRPHLHPGSYTLFATP